MVGSYSPGGQIKDVAINGRYAYIGEAGGGSRLVVVDISNPSSPVFVGSYSAGDSVYGVATDGRYAYIGCNGVGLKVVDVSNPASPSLVGTYNSPGAAVKVAVGGRYVYIADYNTGGLGIIDVSDPANPVLAGSYLTASYVFDVAVSGRYVYLADYQQGMDTILVNGIDAPNATIGTLDVGGLQVLSSARIATYLSVDRGLTIGDGGMSVLGQSSIRTFSGSALVISSSGSNKSALLNVRGNISGASLVISGTGGFSGALLVRQTSAQGSGALMVDQRSTGTGVYIRGSYVASQGNRSPLLALDSGTASSLAPHILFGYKGTFDVSLFRSGVGGLTVASSTGKTLTLKSNRTDATGNLFEIFSDYSSTDNKVFRVQADGRTFADLSLIHI